MVNLTCGKKLCHTCLIGPVILPRVVSKREVLLPTKCVHYALETSIGPFRNPFRMNLRPVKPCAMIKGTGWLKNNSFLIWEFIFNMQGPIQAPILPFILYLQHHNSPGLGIPANIAMYWVGISR